MRSWRFILFHEEYRRLVTRLTPEECAKRLAEETAYDSAEMLATNKGIFSEGFVLRQRGTRRIATGEFVPTPDGTTISVRLRLDRIGRRLRTTMVTLLALSLILIVVNIIFFHISNKLTIISSSLTIIANVLMLCFFPKGNIVPEARPPLRFLSETLDADEVPVVN